MSKFVDARTETIRELLTQGNQFSFCLKPLALEAAKPRITHEMWQEREDRVRLLQALVLMPTLEI